jgi:ppGpp synthetase/RelA/SpoT-type nucleotidyltranferase
VILKEFLHVSDEIGQYYEGHLEENLKSEMHKINKEIESYIKEKCIKDGVFIENSVYKEILPFSNKSRVKSRISLEEKIIRNNIEITNVNDETILKSFDDLIGITVLCTTIEYQRIAYNYIKSYFDEKKEIVSIIKDEKKELFGNKRIPYYHIKINYNQIPVEIQIKSVFLSAFADIEHTLFYKDHNIHEMKDYNKKIMHSLAPILIDLEDILHGIYTHDRKYIENEKVKTTIYKYLLENIENIFGINDEIARGRLNSIFNKSTNYLVYYFKEIGGFDTNYQIRSMAACKDLNIINYMYSEKLELNVIKSVLGDDSNFFFNFMVGKMRDDEAYKDKAYFLTERINAYLEGLNILSEGLILSKGNLQNKFDLLKVFSEFLERIEIFYDDFNGKVDEIPNINMIHAYIILPYISNRDSSEIQILLRDIIKRYFEQMEENEEMDMDLSEEVQKFIFEGWEN